MKFKFLSLLGALALASGAVAQVPSMITYQGRVQVANTNFHGTGQFKFAFVNAAGGVSYWSNDGSSGAGSEPATAVSLSVNRGLYSTLLGSNMLVISPGIFTSSDVWLRVWFHAGTNGAFQLLSPDQRLVSVPYAMMTAQVAPGAVGTTQIQNGAITAAKIANGAITSAQLGPISQLSAPDGSPANAVTVQTNGNVDILQNMTISRNLSVGYGLFLPQSPEVGGGFRLLSSSGYPTWFVESRYGQLQFSANVPAVPQLILNSNGNVGVGTTTPAAKFHVEGDAYCAGNLSVAGPAINWRGSSGEGQVVISGIPHAGRVYIGALDAQGNNANSLIFAGLGLGNLPEISFNAVASLFQGNVGIGTGGTPQQLTLTGGIGFANQNATDKKLYSPTDGVLEWMTHDAAVTKGFAVSHQGEQRVFLSSLGNSFFNGGNVGIGTTSPQAKLHVAGDINIGTDINGRTLYCPGRLHIQSEEHLYLNPSRGGDVIVGGGGGPGHLWVIGTTTTGVLEITGGSDVAEPFAVSNSVKPEPGMVMTIDREHPGELCLSGQAYDRTVAGIISGANGINPGLTLRQKDTVADGTHPVALSGRVYCWCDASHGEIQPGDLLTTSDTPGHAMAVQDLPRAHGATLGKAMTGLKAGKGLVLVLVSLQ